MSKTAADDIYVGTEDAMRLVGLTNHRAGLYKHALCGEIQYRAPNGRELTFHRGDCVRIGLERKERERVRAEIFAASGRPNRKRTYRSCRVATGNGAVSPTIK